MKACTFVGCLAIAAVAQAQAPGHERMVEHLDRIREEASRNHFYLGDAKAQSMRNALQSMRPDAPAVLRWEAHLKLGEEEQHVGEELAAIEHFEECLTLLPEVEGEIGAQWVSRLYYRLGMAYLRFGETQNCALHHATESCILPIRGSGIHVDREPSRRATIYLQEFLKRTPAGTEPYITGRWLLNIAYMTIDGYPDDVPPRFVIPPESFGSDEVFPVFDNVAMRSSVGTYSLSGGVVVEDFDADGSLDLLVSSYDPSEQLRLFVNDGDGTFTEFTDASNLAGILGGLNMVQGDMDNDGDMDVLVLRGAWMGAGGRHPNSLLRNNGDGTFTDVTFESGLGDEHYPSQTAAWADYDLDGDLDLYIGNETTDGLSAPAQLFNNVGGGTFVDVAIEAGVQNLRFTKGVVWGDYDSDRWPDLYVSNVDGDNRLYRNLGDGRFEDVAPQLDVTRPSTSFPVWFWDFDNDGALDIYVAGYDALVDDVALSYLGASFSAELARLYRGDGDGGFEDVAVEMGLTDPTAPMGANFGDLDGDGYPDFYLGTGYTAYHALMPNLMYRNREGRGFSNVTTAGGFGHLQKGHAVAFADFDGDGDQDVFEQMGGALAGDKYNDVLYDNPGFGHHFIDIALTGVGSDRAAVGARIRVQIRENGVSRSVFKFVNSGGSFGANSVLRQMIGLGSAERIERLEIYWPTTDRTQTLTDVSLDSELWVKEPGPASARK